MKRLTAIIPVLLISVIIYSAELKTFTSQSEDFPFIIMYPADWLLDSSASGTRPLITLSKDKGVVKITTALYPEDVSHVPVKNKAGAYRITEQMSLDFEKKYSVKGRVTDSMSEVKINGLEGYYTDREFTTFSGKDAYYMLWVLYRPDFCYTITAMAPVSDSRTITEIRKIVDSFKLKVSGNTQALIK